MQEYTHQEYCEVRYKVVSLPPLGAESEDGMVCRVPFFYFMSRKMAILVSLLKLLLLLLLQLLIRLRLILQLLLLLLWLLPQTCSVWVENAESTKRTTNKSHSLRTGQHR